MLRLAVVVSIAIALLSILSVDTFARDSRTILRADEHGSSIIREISGDLLQQSSQTSGSAQPLRDGGILWQTNLVDAIYTSANIAGPPGVIAAGSYLNEPKHVELVPIEGDGTPDWTYGGLELQTAASRDGSVIAAVDFDSDMQTVTVYRWDPASATPLWSYDIKPATRGSYRTIAVSADGSTIAVSVSMQIGGPAARLYLFDPASPIPIGIYDGAGFARNLSIGEDGRFTAFIGLSTAFVVDRDADLIRWSGSMGATNDPIAISTDGNYLAFGWTTMQMRQWNGSSYESLWSLGGGVYALKTCGFSSDGSTFAAAWNRNTYNQNRVQLFEMPSSSPLWTYTYNLASGEYQDVPSDLALTGDGGFLAVSSWGDEFNTNDEVHLFEHAAATPVLTVNTPGTMFDIDIADDGGCGVYVAACGKHIHANDNGRGGDLLSIHYTCPAGVDDAVRAAAGPSIEILPNPIRATSPIRFALPDPSDASVAIYTPDGRLVRSLLNRSLDAGDHELFWNGKDDLGRAVSSGIYFVALNANGRIVRSKTTLVR